LRQDAGGLESPAGCCGNMSAEPAGSPLSAVGRQVGGLGSPRRTDRGVSLEASPDAVAAD